MCNLPVLGKNLPFEYKWRVVKTFNQGYLTYRPADTILYRYIEHSGLHGCMRNRQLVSAVSHRYTKCQVSHFQVSKRVKIF